MYHGYKICTFVEQPEWARSCLVFGVTDVIHSTVDRNLHFGWPTLCSSGRPQASWHNKILQLLSSLCRDGSACTVKKYNQSMCTSCQHVTFQSSFQFLARNSIIILCAVSKWGYVISCICVCAIMYIIQNISCFIFPVKNSQKSAHAYMLPFLHLDVVNVTEFTPDRALYTPISLLIHVCPSELRGLQGLIDRCMCRKVWSIIKLPLLHVNWWCCTHTERPSNEFPGTLVSEENLTRNVTIAIYSLLYLCYYN